MSITDAIIGFKSFSNIEFIPYLPNPGHEKMVSIMKDPPIAPAISKPKIDTIGIRDGLRRYFITITLSGMPYEVAAII